jgi:hypothetical protein
MGQAFPEASSRTKGRASALLETRILETVQHYAILTVRQLFYVLASKFGYSSSRQFYKILDYHLTKMRRVNAVLNAKFVDPTRHFIAALRPYREVELWVEKDSIRNFLENIAMKYRLSIQVLRGFGSLSMYRKALERAAERGVREILYIGDFDPSGCLIDRVAQREMRIAVHRVTLTREQIQRYGLPFLPVNMRDSRAEEYVAKYGPRCWEVESLRPRTFRRLVEERLRSVVPESYVAEARARDHASRVARPITERLTQLIEQEVFDLLRQGIPSREIFHRLALKYGLPNRRLEK